MDSIANAKLAHTIQKRVKQISRNDRVEYTDIGTITSNGGLKLDNFDPIIPEGDYSKCSKCGELSNDDRVLIVWANGEPVVVDKLI